MKEWSIGWKNDWLDERMIDWMKEWLVHLLIGWNLKDWSIYRQDLKDYMRQAGEVTYADAHKQTRNEGVIEFETKEGMDKALDTLDDTELNGRWFLIRH